MSVPKPLSYPIPPCNGIHTWGSFRPVYVWSHDHAGKMERMCPSCKMTMEEFAKIKTPDRMRASRT